MNHATPTHPGRNRTRTYPFATLSMGALALLASPALYAADSGWYVGGNLGQSRAKVDNQRIETGLQAEGFGTATLADHNHDTGFKLFGGYQINPHFALEGGYFNLGRFGYTATTVPAGSLHADMKVQGLDLDALGLLPITPRWSVFGRVGLIYADTRDSFAGTGSLYPSTTSASKRALGYHYGAGLQYELTDAAALRAEAERYRVKDAVGNNGDIDLISVGLVYRFGAHPAESADRDRASAVTPPAQTVAAAPAVKLITLDDTYFRFGKARLTERAKRLLQQNIETLKANPEMNIRIAGYTSAAGTHHYNQALSERRARSVQSYLIRRGGIAPDRMTTIGYGETRPAQYEQTPSDTDSKAAKANMRVLFEIVVH